LQALGRFWRVAHFVLSDVLDISPEDAVQSWTSRTKRKVVSLAENETHSAVASASSFPRAGQGSDSGADLSPARSLSLPARSFSSLLSEESLRPAPTNDRDLSTTGIMRTTSMNQRAQRFRPELASVLEGQIDSEEMSEVSSVQSGKDAAPETLSASGKAESEAGSLGGSSQSFASPFEAVSHHGHPADGEVDVVGDTLLKGSMELNSEALSECSSAQSRALSDKEVASLPVSLFQTREASSAMSWSREESLEPSASSVGLSQQDSVCTNQSLSSTDISVSPFYQIQHTEASEEDSNAVFLSAASSLGDSQTLPSLQIGDSTNLGTSLKDLDRAASSFEGQLSAKLLSVKAVQHSIMEKVSGHESSSERQSQGASLLRPDAGVQIL
jgi:hypothetical protein